MSFRNESHMFQVNCAGKLFRNSNSEVTLKKYYGAVRNSERVGSKSLKQTLSPFRNRKGPFIYWAWAVRVKTVKEAEKARDINRKTLIRFFRCYKGSTQEESGSVCEEKRR